MASPQTAYRSSDELKSAKYAPAQPSALVRRIQISRLPSNLCWTLISLISASRQGPDFWASTFATSTEAGGKDQRHGYRTVQRHIDQLERMKVLKLKHLSNSFVPGYGMRRTATYVLHEEAGKQLAPREHYAEWRERNRRAAPRKRGPQSVVRSKSQEQEPVETKAPVLVQQAAAGHRSPRREAPPLSNRLRAELAKMVPVCMEGHGKGRQIDGEWIGPGHPRYLPPQSKKAAALMACQFLAQSHGVSLERAIEAAREAGFEVEVPADESPP